MIRHRRRPKVLTIVVPTTAFALLILIESACRPKPEEGDDELPSNERVLEETKRISNGDETVGDELIHPTITIDAAGKITHNKKLLAPLPTSQPLARLETRLKRDREHWKQIHPGLDFQGSAEVWCDASVPAALLGAVLWTVGERTFERQQLRITPQRGSTSQTKTTTTTRTLDLRSFVGTRWFGPSHAPPFVETWRIRPESASSNRYEVEWVGPPFRYGSPTYCVSARQRRDVTGLEEVAAVIEAAGVSGDEGERDFIVETPDGMSAEALFETMKALRSFPALETALVSFISKREVPSTALVPDSGSLQARPPPSSACPPAKLDVDAMLERLAKKRAAFFVNGQKPPKPPNLRIGSRMMNGPLSDKEADSVIQTVKQDLLGCYLEGLLENPALEGRATLKLVVTKRGEVTSASDGGSALPDQNVVNCLVRQLGRLTFKPAGLTTMVQPIIFSPGD